jgi:hypothetical protein
MDASGGFVWALVLLTFFVIVALAAGVALYWYLMPY